MTIDPLDRADIVLGEMTTMLERATAAAPMLSVEQLAHTFALLRAGMTGLRTLVQTAQLQRRSISTNNASVN
jgi:hypothetical protein